MLKVIFLGTSGSAPTIERGMPAIAIKYEGDTFLFDCGEGTQRQMMRFGVGYGSIDAIFISHPHVDHYLGLFGLLETLNLSHTQKKLDIYGFKDFAWISEKYPFVNFHNMKKGQLLKKSEYTISAFPVKHCKGSYALVFQENEKIKFHEEKAKAAGIRGRLFREIEEKGFLYINNKKIKLEEVSWKKPGRKIVYSGDTLPTSDMVEIAKNADLLIHEATFAQDKEKEAAERFHTTIKQAAEIAKKAGVKQLALMHFSPRYANLDQFKDEAREIFQNTVFAYDGLTIEIK